MDTHAIINTLQKEYKIPPKTAEAIVYVVQEGQASSELVTKAELKAELAELKADLKDSLTMRMIGIVSLGVAVLVLIRYFG